MSVSETSPTSPSRNQFTAAVVAGMMFIIYQPAPTLGDGLHDYAPLQFLSAD